MATFSSRVVTVNRYEWSIPLPTNPAEYAKALTAAAHAAAAHGINTSYDDWCILTADDEHLVISFTVVGA